MTEEDSSVAKALETPEQQDFHIDKEAALWYKRVMKWTYENRRAYMSIKACQLA